MLDIALDKFSFQQLDKETINNVRASWDFQSLGDSNKPHKLLLDRIISDLERVEETSCLAPVYFAVRDKESGDVVALSEMVFASAGGELLKVKQLDTHLCPVLRDKVLLEEEEDAVNYAVLVYIQTIAHAFVLNETLRPRILKLYARDKIQLEHFKKFAEVFSNKESLKSLRLEIKGRWLEITGSLTGEKNDQE